MIECIEDGFFDLLQSDIVIEIGGVKYRAGKFLNFRIKELFIQIDIIVKGKIRNVDIPIPYTAIYEDNILILSYKFEDMGNYGADVDSMLRNAIGGGKSKLYNKLLTIRRV